MAKGFNTLHIKSAVKSRNKFDLSRTHLTTMDFGQIVPLFVEETIPGDKFNVGSNYFSRMAPLVKPTYGKFQFKTVSVFVPYHQIADDADAWLAGKNQWEGTTTKHRFMYVRDLAEFVCTYCFAPVSEEDSLENCDVAYTNASGNYEYRRYSEYGRYWVKILNSLGYAVPQGINLSTSSVWYTTGAGAEKLSGYPLLAFFKAYNDWMSQSQKFNTSNLSRLLKNVRNNVADTGYSTTGQLSAVLVWQLFLELKLNYENDYFTSAWRYPDSAIGVSQSISSIQAPYSISDEVVRGDIINYNVDGVKISSVGSAGYSSNLAQRTLDFLKSFDDWVRRNNYSGSRAVQQIYSRFGIKTDDYKTNYAHVIKTDSSPIQVGDVTATAQDFVGEGSSKNVTIGDYAGKGIMSSGDGFDFTADDYGLLMILGYFTVSPMMAYGYDRRVLRTEPLDYYNPEFDGLGADAISLGEVFTNSTWNPDDDPSSDKQIFGFTERYNSYRYGRDVITGEFRNMHEDSEMNTWHTGRLLTDVRYDDDMVAQSDSMNTLSPVSSEYNRIFSITDGSVDHFYLTAQFNVSAVRPILSINQAPRLGEGDTTVPRNGNVIN